MDAIKEMRLGAEAEKIRNDKVAVETQRVVRELLDKVNNLEKQVEQNNGSSNSEKPPIEFCCADCSIIHSKEQCPNCGSQKRRIYEDIGA